MNVHLHSRCFFLSHRTIINEHEFLMYMTVIQGKLVYIRNVQ